jgi:hypothetical protein
MGDTNHDSKGSATSNPTTLLDNLLSVRMMKRMRRHQTQRKFCHLPSCLYAAAFLVPSETHRCSQCRSARYCGKQCQRRHWAVHKADCKENARTMQARWDAGLKCSNCHLLSTTAFQCDGCHIRDTAPWFCSQECLVRSKARHHRECSTHPLVVDTMLLWTTPSICALKQNIYLSLSRSLLL